MRITKEDTGTMVLKESGLFLFTIGLALFALAAAVFIKPESFDKKYIIGIIAGIMGLACLYGTQWRSVNIDKSTGTLTISVGHLIGKQERTILTLKDIKAVLITSMSDQDEGQVDKVYGIGLRTGSESIELTVIKQGNDRNPREIGKRLATFLNVPVEDKENESDAEAAMKKLTPQQQAKVMNFAERAGKFAKTFRIVKIAVFLFIIAIIGILFLRNHDIDHRYSTLQDGVFMKIHHHTNNEIHGKISGANLIAASAEGCESFTIEEGRTFSAYCAQEPSTIILQTSEGERAITQYRD